MTPDAIQSFFAMGGYGQYIWPSYLVAALVLGVLLLLSRAKARKLQAELEALQALRRDAGWPGAGRNGGIGTS